MLSKNTLWKPVFCGNQLETLLETCWVQIDEIINDNNKLMLVVEDNGMETYWKLLETRTVSFHHHIYMVETGNFLHSVTNLGQE